MMDQAHMERILPRCTETERAELSTKYNAYIRWLKAYQADSSRTNLTELDAAKRSLAATTKEIEARLDDAAAEAESLPNLKAAIDYLKSDGWKIAKSKLYADAKAGLIKVNADGTVTKADTLAYAAKCLKKTSGAGQSGRDSKIYEERTNEETALTRIRRAKLEFEFDRDRGLYILKSDARAEIAIKIAALEAGIKHFFRTFAADWIHRVGGDPKHARMAIDWFNAEVDHLLDEFGRMEEIDVIVVKDPGNGRGPEPSPADRQDGIFDAGEDDRPAVEAAVGDA